MRHTPLTLLVLLVGALLYIAYGVLLMWLHARRATREYEQLLARRGSHPERAGEELQRGSRMGEQAIGWNRTP
jgi:hypothetical protein